MPSVAAIVIGAGQAGLAMSYCLSQRRIEHILLERGRIAERWLTERWDSLRLLTPNWMTRLPGWSYAGDDPDGFMPSEAFAAYLAGYAASAGAPVEHDTTVLSVRRTGSNFHVITSGETWHSQAVVIATGHCDVPVVPAMANALPAMIEQITSANYRNPRTLPGGSVLVVGGSAAGVQLADEIRRSGREVYLSTGRHTRLPRHYRGRDVWWWLEQTGLLDEPLDDPAILERARRAPSFQLVGRPDRATLDLGTLHAAGVHVLGRARGADGGRLLLQQDLPETTTGAQSALERLLQRFDALAMAGTPLDAADAARVITLPPAPAMLDLSRAGVGCVIWATGYWRDYSWLHIPVFDAAGEVVHDGGITSVPGLYVLGLRAMRRRRSNFIDGVGRDADELAAHLSRAVGRRCRAAA
jgi:putative flavoprotein involved in K+ transport